jgi:hypothetical protein
MSHNDILLCTATQISPEMDENKATNLSDSEGFLLTFIPSVIILT